MFIPDPNPGTKVVRIVLAVTVPLGALEKLGAGRSSWDQRLAAIGISPSVRPSLPRGPYRFCRCLSQDWNCVSQLNLSFLTSKVLAEMMLLCGHHWKCIKSADKMPGKQ